MSVLKMVVIVAVVFSMAACGPGEPGPQGPQGKAGSGLTRVLTCYGFADSDGDKLGWGLYHDVYTFADKSVLATCEVHGGDTASSSVLMHMSGTPGARVGGCVVRWDEEQNGTSGDWKFEVDTENMKSKATYDDPGSPVHGRAFSLSCY